MKVTPVNINIFNHIGSLMFRIFFMCFLTILESFKEHSSNFITVAFACS